MPALAAGVLVLRAWSLWQAGALQPSLAAAALLQDALAFARGLPLLFLLSWPLLQLSNARARMLSLAALWALWLGVQVALEQYFLVARTPLGADLFGYSWREIGTTAGGSVRSDFAALAGWGLPLAAFAGVLAWRARQPVRWSAKVSASVLLACAPAWLLPSMTPHARSEDARGVAANKLAWFAADNLRYWKAGEVAASSVRAPAIASATSADGARDPAHPFVHADRTPDVLGPHFATASSRPPHLVFILVEGLGRSFSGPDASHGSFTPFLDELAGRSLYWSNFLANQGRTFAVLPSVFGSLPFGAKGYSALGERMPAHAGLIDVLRRQGYTTRFYGGFDAGFDNERTFLQRQGVERIVDADDFGAGQRRNPYDSWGYDDAELVSRVLADGAVADAGNAAPTITIVQTMSMHAPYRFAGQDAYRRRFEQRLDELGLGDADKAARREAADIYASVLFTDDALRRYFEAAQRAPGYEDTVFVVTGDHRLPELPMDTRIERYHVPLIVFSPRLAAPQRFRAVSSQLDIAPSLLAYLAHVHGLRRPAHSAWLGRGLDAGAEFRSRGDIPLKHAKTLLSDFVSGPWLLGEGRLYRLEDNLRIAEVEDAQAQAAAQARFDRFRAANDLFARTLRLSPEGATPALADYAAPAAATETTAADAAAPASPRTLYAHDARVPEGVDDELVVSARFTNGGGTPGAFVPLLVLSDESGREVREGYADPLQLAPGQSGAARFRVPLAGLEAGRYFVAVLPSHPDTGKRVGEGVFRRPVKVRCCAPGGGLRARP